MKNLLSILLVIVAVCALPTAPVSAKTMPVDTFAALPGYSRPKLSPDGQTIAYATNYKGKTAIVLQPTNGAQSLMIPPLGDQETRGFRWANNDVLLLTAGKSIIRHAIRGKSYNTRVLAFNRKKDKFIWLGKPKQSGVTKKTSATQYASQIERVIDYLPSDPQHILLSLDLNLDTNAEVYKVNVFSGSRKLVQKGHRGISRWFTDHTSKVRMGVGYERNKWFAMFRNADDNWVSLTKVDWANKYDIMGFSTVPNILYVSGMSEHGTDGLFTLDVRSGEIIKQLFAHEQVDIDSHMEHPLTGQVAGVAYTDDFRRVKFFDKELAHIQRSLNRALKGTVNTIISRAKERELYLLLVESDTNPGDYYLFDRDKGQLHFISPSMQQVDIETTAPTKTVTIPVRDGESIPGYLTIPPGTDGKNLPAIVLPHGGPSSRDTAKWDFWAQFYANRGYAVLKPNFRGSSGYGHAFYLKGHKQWGGVMQNDITDATHWMIKEGIADPERICIVGASFGGYAALMGVIKEKNLYKCAISVNGVTDLPRLKGYDKQFEGGGAWTKNMVLEGAKDGDISPYDRAADISAPVLLMSSKDDARIPYKMSKDMHKRLKKLKKQSAYVEISDGGHYLLTAASRITILKETEKFLAKHIGD